jgi:hypothetical protein
MKQETVVNSEQVKGEHQVGKWMGAFMVFMGAIFLMGTSGITIAGHSPSMLIALLPIYWIGVSAYRRYKEDGPPHPPCFQHCRFRRAALRLHGRDGAGLQCLRPVASRHHCRWRFIPLVGRQKIELVFRHT